MSIQNSQELHVSIDVGCYTHDISVGLADGETEYKQLH